MEEKLKVDKECANDSQIVESSLESESIMIENTNNSFSERDLSSYARKRHGKEVPSDSTMDVVTKDHIATSEEKRRSWRRILLLIVAITVHNVPGNCHFFYISKYSFTVA